MTSTRKETKEMDTNKFGVPYHGYTLTLKSGREVIMDIGYEEEWGNVQQCFKDGSDGKLVECVGWGDADEWDEVVNVFDYETKDNLAPLPWAEENVWKWADKYSS